MCGKGETGDDKKDSEDGEFKSQIPKVWQEAVDNESGEEGEAVDDKEDKDDGEE